MNTRISSLTKCFKLTLFMLYFPMTPFVFAAAIPLTQTNGKINAATQDKPFSDVIARVEDQEIHFSEINTLLNSSAVVGLSIPSLGTPQRDMVRITLLDKMVSANLIYLDALDKGLDKDPEYRQAIRQFANGVLADLYYRQNLSDDTHVSEQDIRAVYDESVLPGTTMTKALREVIETNIRKRKISERQAQIRNRLLGETKLKIYEDRLLATEDKNRSADTVLAVFSGGNITWGEVKQDLIAAGKRAVLRDLLAMDIDGRVQAVQAAITTRIMAQRAREAGLDSNPGFRSRIREYRKTKLINLHRTRLANAFSPTEIELKRYYNKNRDKITTPEFRKVQLISLNSKSQAEVLKDSIEAGHMTMFQAAAELSLAPDAKQNLGEIGWIAQGQLTQDIDTAVFALGPGQVGGPVFAGDLWHLVTVVDIRDARYSDLSDAETRTHTRRRYIHDKLNAYTVGLRQKHFKVEVYQDALLYLSQQESNMVMQLNERAQKPSSLTQQRIREMRKSMQKP